MNNALKLLTSISEELLRVVEAGYDLVLHFQDGQLFGETNQEIVFSITGIKPSHGLQGTIYKVILSDGRKGFYVIPWKQNDE